MKREKKYILGQPDLNYRSDPWFSPCFPPFDTAVDVEPPVDAALAVRRRQIGWGTRTNPAIHVWEKERTIQSINQSIDRSTNQLTDQSIHPSIHSSLNPIDQSNDHPTNQTILNQQLQTSASLNQSVHGTSNIQYSVYLRVSDIVSQIG